MGHRKSLHQRQNQTNGRADYSIRLPGLPGLLFRKVMFMSEIPSSLMGAAREWLKARCAVDDSLRNVVLDAFVDPSERNLTRFVAYLLAHDLLVIRPD